MSYGVYRFGPDIALREVLEPDVETLMRFMIRTTMPIGSQWDYEASLGRHELLIELRSNL
jgi:hypothetical protein